MKNIEDKILDTTNLDTSTTLIANVNEVKTKYLELLTFLLILLLMLR